VIPLQPDLEEVGEPAILRDVLRREMAVVVDDRLMRRAGLVEPARRVAVKQKIAVDECHRR